MLLPHSKTSTLGVWENAATPGKGLNAGLAGLLSHRPGALDARQRAWRLQIRAAMQTFAGGHARARESL